MTMSVSTRSFSSAVRAAIATGLLAVFLSASPALGHASLTGTDPVDGAVLETAPETITLQFNEEPLEALVDVVVTNAAGDVMAMNAAEAAGTEVLVPFPTGLAAGDYTVAYRVVSADGHPITGSITITLANDDVSASPAESSSGDAPTQPTIDETAAAEVLDDVAAADSGSSMVIFLVVGAIAAAVLIGVVVVVRRRS